MGVGQCLPHVRIGAEGRRLRPQDEVVAHARGGRDPYAVEVLGAWRLEVEVPGAVVAAVLQCVDRPECTPGVAGAESQILVVPWPVLAVQVDMEQLAVPERLRQSVGEVQAGHLLVAHLRVEAHQIGVFQLVDERERMADRRQQDVAARLVRLGLDRDAHGVALVEDVPPEDVERLLVAIERGAHVLRRARLGAFPPAPGDERAGAE